MRHRAVPFHLFVCFLVATHAATTVMAQSPSTPSLSLDDTITVTADRVEAPRTSVGSSVTVLTEAEIARHRKVTVAEILRTVPGVEVTRTAGPGTQTSLFLRGGASAATLVLIDGARVNSPATGGFDFADLQTDNIERIEIVRGPQSTLYGSEAMGGVISITTKRGAGPAKGQLTVAGGDDGFFRGAAQVSGGQGRLDYAISASDASSDGVSLASERAGNTESDAHENRTASARLGLGFANGGRIDLTLRGVDAELDVDGFGFTGAGFGPIDDLNATQTRESLLGVVSASIPLGERWTQRVEVSVADEELTNEDPDTVFNNFASDVRTTAVSTQAEIAWSDRGILVAGAAHEDREAVLPGSFDDDVDLTSFYLQQRWTWGDQTSVSLGVRNDDHATFGDETTYRLTMSAGLGDRDGGASGRFHGSFGTGFRAPSLNELYFPFFGNPALRPETSEGFDLGFEGTWGEGRWRGDVTYFDNTYDDLIGTDSAFQAINIDQADTSGVEVSIRYTPSNRWRLAASHTYTDTEDRATGLALPRRPENRTVVDVFVQPGARWDATITGIQVADRVDVGGAPMDDYTRVDLTAGYRVRERIELFVRAENLLDEDYEEVPGFTTPGQTTVAGFRYGF